jgi:hypothetical protein
LGAEIIHRCPKRDLGDPFLRIGQPIKPTLSSEERGGSSQSPRKKGYDESNKILSGKREV